MSKTILMIIPGLGPGGAERSFSNLSNELNKKFQVINVVFNHTSKQMYPLDAMVLSLEVKGGGSVLTKAVNFIRRVIRLRKIKKTYKVDTSISFLEGADYVNILSRTHDKVILSIRGSKLYDGNIHGWHGYLRKKLLIPLLYNRANAIVAVNKGIVRELNESFNLKSVKKTVIHNFYDPAEILKLAEESLPEQIRWLVHEEYIVIFSRLAREKNILPIISVFALLKRKGFGGKLLIIGGGPEEDKIPEHCNKVSLKVIRADETDQSNADVVLVGPDPNPFKYVKHATYFLMASESEGFPNALVEAMILGVPVISADCPWGPKEILNPTQEDGNGSFTTTPLMADFGILIPHLSENETTIKAWGEWLSNIIGDSSLHNYYKERSYHGTLPYTKESAISRWEVLIMAMQ